MRDVASESPLARVRFGHRPLGLALAGGCIVVMVAAGAALAAPPLDGLRLMGADGQSLGVVSCLSIGSKVTPYGSPIGQFSIWNVFGKYGSVVSDYSAYSVIASRPPALFDSSGNLVAYVTKNAVKIPRVAPKLVEAHLMDRCGQDEYRND